MQPGSDKPSQENGTSSEVDKFVDFIAKDSREHLKEEDFQPFSPIDELDAKHELLCDQLVDRMQKRLESAINGQTEVIYAAYPTDERGLPIDNLDEIAIRGRIQVIDDVWDKYTGEIITDPTWMDLAIEANRMIAANGDTRHKWFENFEVLGSKNANVTTITLDVGS
ncbi:MAG: hypothetical protein AAF591_00555 [Verrucomicrobiota bacterium]